MSDKLNVDFTKEELFQQLMKKHEVASCVMLLKRVIDGRVNVTEVRYQCDGFDILGFSKLFEIRGSQALEDRPQLVGGDNE